MFFSFFYLDSFYTLYVNVDGITDSPHTTENEDLLRDERRKTPDNIFGPRWVNEATTINKRK